MIYLDYAATTPMSETALDAYLQTARQFFGNASSLHDAGSEAKYLLESARSQLASLLNGSPEGLYFTSGGSEANSLAIRSLVKANRHKGKHLITTPIEHSSVSNIFHFLEKEGYEISYLPVDSYGKVHMEALERLIRPETVLASIGHANSEIGTVQAIEQIGALLFEHNVLFHSDCVQSFGKIPIDVRKSHITSLSLSAHKIYGPKGVGACYISPFASWEQLIPGTTHEKGFRAGTVNVPGAVAFAAAADEKMEGKVEESVRLSQLREQLLSGIMKKGFPVFVEGDQEKGLPHHIAVRFPGIEGQHMMLECNRSGVALSTGTACQAGMQSPSKTLLAIGRNENEARELVRITLGHSTTAEEIAETIKILTATAQNFYARKRGIVK